MHEGKHDIAANKFIDAFCEDQQKRYQPDSDVLLGLHELQTGIRHQTTGNTGQTAKTSDLEGRGKYPGSRQTEAAAYQHINEFAGHTLFLQAGVKNKKGAGIQKQMVPGQMNKGMAEQPPPLTGANCGG